MSTSFYKYIVDSILVDYFSDKIAKAGDHYCLVIENNDRRRGVVEALAASPHSKKIIISDIYEGRKENASIDRYETCEFDADDDGKSVPLIIADVDSGKEYLPTIRNSVNAGKKYENYATLFILSNNAAVDTLSTASINLESDGYPLCAKEMKKYITQKLNTISISLYEGEYIKKTLEKIANQIENESCDLFDFEDVLHVLETETIRGSFNKLEYFNDGIIFNNDFHDKQISKRISENQYYFNIINTIVSNPDDDDKEGSLCKYLDEKMAKKIVSNLDDWQNIDFSDIKESIDKKNATATLANLKVSLFDQNDNEIDDDQYYFIPGPTTKKKSTSYYIICHNDTKVSAKIEFNKNIKDKISDGKIKVRERFAYPLISDKVVNFFVGEGDNRHFFSFLRIPAKKVIFENVAKYTKITSKGDLVVTVPEDIDSLNIGNGATEFINPKDEIEWNDDYKITLLNDDIEETKKIIDLDFSGQKLKITFNFDNAKILPKQPLDFLEYIWTNKESFFDARNQNFAVLSNESKTIEYSSSEGRFRDLLVLENHIIQDKAFYIKDYNSEDGSYRVGDLTLDRDLEKYLNEIFSYYQRKETVPSLSYLDKEITELYKKYLDTILHIVNNIEPGSNISAVEHAVTKLGVVECSNGGIWLSPFHPINIAFILAFKENFDGKESHRGILKLIGPYYLIPFLSINSNTYCPQMDEYSEDFKTWLFYDRVKNLEQNHTYNIATQMVKDKLNAFLTQFKYLFKTKECPIIVNTFGISDDTNIIKGIILYIISQCQKDHNEQIQRIELHEYVKNIHRESFYERLNRLGSDDYIVNELLRLKIKIDGKEKYTSREIIRILFTRVSFFKHDIIDSDNKNGINYSHIAFYQMDTNSEYYSNKDIEESYPNTETLRTELSLDGLISIPSTKNELSQYILGYGTKGVKANHSIIYDVARAMNEVYTVEKQNGLHMGFQHNRCIAKVHKFEDQMLLKEVYRSSNWVTFLNPEVDLDFFYKQKDVYIIHYTDQYTINAKYDSITVTTHTDRYNELIYNSFDEHLKSSINKEQFAANMFAYFNSLNGRWLMNIANEQKYQVQEKISLVAAVNVMRNFLKNKSIIWVPVSLDEILRVSGSIGLPKEYIFTAKDLNSKGPLSDDLLMIGLDHTKEKTTLYFYPTEVKYGDSNLSEKGEIQVANTYNLLRKKLFGDDIHFVKKVYKTFFASQFLTNAEKLKANELLSANDYEIIESFRFDLLNGNYSILENNPNENAGVAGLVTFNPDVNHIQTTIIEDVPICHINLNKNECFKFVDGSPLDDETSFLKDVSVNEDFLNCLNNISKNIPDAELYLEDDDGDEPTVPSFENDPSQEQNVENEENDEQTTESSTEKKDQVDSNGIQLTIGSSLKGSGKFFLYPNDTSKVTHPNMGIIGTMGTGKTQFARSIIAQFSKESRHNVNQTPVGMLVFDYKGDYNDDDFLNRVGGSCFKSSFPFNPLKLVVTENVKSLNLPAITAGRIADSMTKSFGLGDVQSLKIKDSIVDTYRSVGINKDPSTWHLTPPTMQQVVDYYLENNDARDKAYKIFSTLNDYQLFTSDASNCVSLFEWLNSVKVIDLTLYEDSVKKLIVSLILDLFYAEMKQLRESATDGEFRQLRAMILVDEAHQFMKMKFDSLRKIISEGRMFGVGMILSTQNLSDFKADEDYSSFIKSWVIHNVGTVKTSDMNSIFGPDPDNDRYQKFISQAKKFESICKIGTQSPVFMKDLPYYKLIEEDERFKEQK